MILISQLLTYALFLPMAIGAPIISKSNSRLPMSLSAVISDLEAEGVSSLTTACFLTSRSVTAAEKTSMLGIDGNDASTTAFGTSSGLCIAVSSLASSSIAQMASTAVSCGGSLVYCPHKDDLARGEGLFDSLGPAIERIINDGAVESPTLVVVSSDPQSTKSILDAAASAVLGNLVSSSKKPIAMLEDVFDFVTYVSSIQEAMQHLEATTSQDPATAQARIASTVASDFWQGASNLQASTTTATTTISGTSSMSARDLAAARRLGPASRKALDTAIETVRQLLDGTIVSNFGELYEAATQRALDELDSSSSLSSSSNVGKQIRATLKAEVTAELQDLCEGQLELLKTACFEEFKRELSKLRITPYLADDMQNVANKSLSTFTERAKKMPIDTSGAKAAIKKEMQDFSSDRLLAARASGAFRPIPRKGVTVGMHWLFPKPFGNDYRQEPWMVQATDNLMYIPKDKITDVNPGEVKVRDWIRKIVPAPSGNEMIYLNNDG